MNFIIIFIVLLSMIFFLKGVEINFKINLFIDKLIFLSHPLLHHLFFFLDFVILKPFFLNIFFLLLGILINNNIFIIISLILIFLCDFFLKNYYKIFLDFSLNIYTYCIKIKRFHNYLF